MNYYIASNEQFTSEAEQRTSTQIHKKTTMALLRIALKKLTKQKEKPTGKEMRGLYKLQREELLRARIARERGFSRVR